MSIKYTVKKVTYQKAMPKAITPKSHTTIADFIKIVFAFLSQRK